MDSTEVIRTRNSLQIRWANGSGDLWTVTKRFNLGTRILERAEIACSAESWPEVLLTEALQAQELAATVDLVFTRPEDFDRVQVANWEPEDGMPAQIRALASGPIEIAKRKEPTDDN